MIDLRNKIKDIIIRETEAKHFCELDLTTSVELIQHLLENYEITSNLHQDFSNLPKDGELIFLVAPTGAGKDSLVIKLNIINPEKKYVELNMDMFRHYFPLFIKDLNSITDKTFAERTNQFSYEIFMTIQEIILNEFPGTNIIITGTLREISWPEQILENYKNSKTTNYKTKIISLAVPKEESAFSTIKRYAEIIDDQVKRSDFQKGSTRYTSLAYHDETFERFAKNLNHFEESFKKYPGKYIDSMEVYRRSKTITDFKDDNLVYSSEREQDKNTTALNTVKELREKEYKIDIETANYILDKIINNIDYLKTQDTFYDVMTNLKTLLNL